MTPGTMPGGGPQGQLNELSVVVNWFEELRRRVPMGN